MKNRELSNKIIFMLGCLLGVIAFVYIYGIDVLNVTYDGWLIKEGGDMAQHYIGWKFFRISSWNFPFGLIDGLVYPAKVSIMYMDSIPLFAIIFKILSPILPTTFQYFGIWGLISFMLQGGLAAIIIRKFTSNYLICIISAVFFLLSPIMIFRLFGHASLGGHWIILLSIYILIDKYYDKSLKRNIVVWGMISCLSINIHIYFLPMVMIILLCNLVIDYFENKKIYRVLIIFISSILLSLATLFLLGAFYGNSDYQTIGLGFYSANLNALFNPQGYSNYLNSLPMATEGQYEGLAYIGLGAIVAVIVAIYIRLGNLFKEKNEGSSIYIKNNLHNVILGVTLIVFFILALSPQVSLNKDVLLNIPYPKIFIKILNIFRASGRFMWPICYIIIIYTIKEIIDSSKKKQAIIFLGFCIIIQICDLTNMVKIQNNHFANRVEYVSELKSPFWTEISKMNYRHIVFLKDTVPNNTYLWSLCDYSANNKITLNDGYIARKDTDAVKNIKKQYLQNLQDGISEEDVIYIFGFDKNIIYSLKDYPLNYYNVDGVIIGVKEKIPNMNDYKDEHNKLLEQGIDILPKNNNYLEYGHDSEKGRILNPQGKSYGPYLDIEKGNYTIEINGENLDKINKYDLCYNKGENNVNIHEIERSNTNIVFKFSVDNNFEDLECRVVNTSSEDVLLSKILIIKQAE